MTGRQVNIYLQEETYLAVRSLVGPRQISRYINEAVEARLNQEQKQKQTELQQKLVRGYQAMAKNKKLRAELAIWEETLGDSYQ
jgi:cell shape-determining protein MreC